MRTTRMAAEVPAQLGRIPRIADPLPILLLQRFGRLRGGLRRHILPLDTQHLARFKPPLHRPVRSTQSHLQLLIASGSLAADPGKAIEGTAYSDVNAMLVNPGRSVYTANQEGQTLPLGEPEKNVMQGNLLMSLRTANHQRVLALHLTNGSTLLISKPMTPTEHLVRQLDIMSVVIGGIGVAIAAVASAAVTRARRAARSLCADSA